MDFVLKEELPMAENVNETAQAGATVAVNGVAVSEAPSRAEPSVTTLVSGIIVDAQQLIQQQFAMFRSEIRSDVRKAKEGVFGLAVGAGIALIGVALLALVLSLALHEAVPGLPLWICCGIVGAALTILGGIVVYASLKKLESFNPLSDQSAEGLKENWQWKSNPK
jgi:Putative Actinobacterial Holin-X, holin superfamily III